jgi:CHRD domain
MNRLRTIKLLFIAIIVLSVFGLSAAVNRNYRTHLSGDEEVPVRVTNAQGQAIFQLSKDGSELSYKLIVANIENVVQAHIHVGQPGVNGPIVVFLYGLVPAGGGRTDGVLAEGTITSANLINSLAGQPLSTLVAAMEAGNTYVNVHTNDGVAPINSGPGDFPGGEVRGQID